MSQELQHLLRLIEIEYHTIKGATQNIEKHTKRIENIVGADEAARLVSEVLGCDPEKTQPLSEDEEK